MVLNFMLNALWVFLHQSSSELLFSSASERSAIGKRKMAATPLSWFSSVRDGDKENAWSYGRFSYNFSVEKWEEKQNKTKNTYVLRRRASLKIPFRKENIHKLAIYKHTQSIQTQLVFWSIQPYKNINPELGLKPGVIQITIQWCSPSELTEEWDNGL